MEKETLDEIGQKYVTNYKLGRGKEYKGGDKTVLGKGFTLKYHELFKHLRDDKIQFLELGVLYGRSIAMWSEYFPKGLIHGVDISLGPFEREEKTLRSAGAFKNDNVKLYKLDLTQPEFEEFIKETPLFDIIIDDALHKSKAQINNLKLLWPKLKSGGIYVIEDLVTPTSLINGLSDLMACVGNPEAKSSHASNWRSIGNQIQSIEINTNLFIIKKK